MQLDTWMPPNECPVFHDQHAYTVKLNELSCILCHLDAKQIPSSMHVHERNCFKSRAKIMAAQGVCLSWRPSDSSVHALRLLPSTYIYLFHVFQITLQTEVRVRSSMKRPPASISTLHCTPKSLYIILVCKNSFVLFKAMEGDLLAPIDVDATMEE